MKPNRRSVLAALVGATAATAGCSGGSDGGKPSTQGPPEVAWDWYWNPGRDRLTVFSLGPEEVAGGRLALSCGDREVSVSEGPVAPGDRVVATGECAVGETARLRWRPPNESDPVVIGRFEVVDHGASSEVQPAVALDWRWDAAAGRLTVVHEAGDTAYGSRLTVECDSSDVPVADGAYEPGDEILSTTECAPGDRVSLVWISPDGEDTALVAEFEVPADD